MANDRWQRIEEIFEIAVELPAGEREAYLEQECGDDIELRREVEDLISADLEAEEFIEEPLLGSHTLANFLDEKVGAMEDIESSVPPHFLGRRIGAYRLIRELGRGGMGAVFLASRDDAEFKKSVAIKLIKRGMDTDFILKRFRNERQILATLDHPFIARLLDGGTTDDELPYFVMEYIEGTPIHKYCDENRLTIRERLQLFQKVCSAVNYAHQNLIIHRDLKPGNILVTRDVLPKLLDFGIAKILNPALAADTLAPTLTGMRLMTPEYASPEQIRGEKLSPASDIYSLGVLLYEILTGKRPYRFSSRAPHDIARVVCEEPPEDPAAVLTDDNVQSVIKSENDLNTLENLSRNRRTTPETLVKELSGSLKNILLKALRKSPVNRYASAEELSDDIQAYLDGLPVSVPEIETSTPDNLEDSMPSSESLAILPFRMFRWKTSKNGEPDTDDFLSIGLADALISRLSGLKTLSVRPTSSVVKYASDDVTRENAGAELGVTHILDGRIQHIGSRVRVTAQLVHLRNNETMWAGQFDEQLDDILTLQDSISAQVADALIDQLTGEEREKIKRRGTDNPKAYEAYLRGRFYWHSYEVENLAKALVCFYEAIAHDAEFALAYTGVADYFNFLSVFGLMSPEESFPAAKEAAQKAIELDDSLAEAYTSLAVAVLGYDWNFAESRRLLKKALRLNPNYGEGRVWYAHLLGLQNKHEESLREMKRAEKLNTVSASLLVNYAIRLRDARKFDEALVKIRQAQKMSPSYNIGVQAYCWVVDYTETNAEAEEACRLAFEKNEDLNLPTYAYAYVLAAGGKREKALELVKLLEERKAKSYVPSSHLVLIYIALGENDLAFKWLDKAFAERDFWAIWLPVDPRYDALKNDQRFNLYAAQIRPLGDDEIHQSHIPTRILTSDDITEPKTLIEKSAKEKSVEQKVETIPVTEKSFPRRYVYWSIAAAILLGLVFHFYQSDYFSVEVKQNSSAPVAGNIPPAGSLEKTLVIFPFGTDADAENEESFGDGLADSINKKLGQVSQISVRTSKEAFDETKTAKEIGAQFGANYVLRGRLHTTVDRIQVTAELLNAAENKTVWLETFDESILDFPNLQTEIAEKILKALTVDLSIADRERFNKNYTIDSEAYQQYLVGRYQMRTRRPENLRAAIENFEKAKTKDPNFVLAYVGLADCFSLLNIYQVPPPPDAYENAKKNAIKALELDETVAEAHASLAYILFYGDWNRTEAERHFRRSIELNPSYPTTHHWYAMALAAMGKTDESIQHINAAMQLEPKSAIIHAAGGLVYFYARRYDEALELCRKSLEINDKFIPAYDQLVMIYEAVGDFEKANEAYSKQRLFSGYTDPNDPGWLMVTAQVQSLTKDKRTEAEINLQKSASSAEVINNPRGYAYEVAIAYALLDDRENAIKWIEASKKSKNQSFNFINVDPRVDNLRQEAKFKELTENAFQ